MRFIDLSVPIEEGPSEMLAPEIVREDHEAGSRLMQSIFNCAQSDLPGGLGWATERITLNTHTGTHLDAPYHYSPSSEGRPARTIDQIPLEWCFADAFVLLGEPAAVDHAWAGDRNVGKPLAPDQAVMGVGVAAILVSLLSVRDVSSHEVYALELQLP